MPTLKNYAIFIMINLAFIGQIIAMVYFRAADDIKNNWPLYRCNPSYWVFSEDVATDFNYCIQNTQSNTMSYLLQPMNYLVSNLTSFSGDLGESLNKTRDMISNIRSFTSGIIEKIFGIFSNLIIEFQKILLAIKDMVGKIIGIVTTILFIIDGTIKTMHSMWNGPPGKMVKSIGSCFHPDTKIKTKGGEIYAMSQLPLGVELEDGGKVFSVLKVDNPKKELLYRISDASLGPIYVTGEHYILEPESNKFIQVKDYKDAVWQTEVYSSWFSCIITTNRRIPIGKHIFWDWEDDELTKC